METSLLKRLRPALIIFSGAALILIGMTPESWAKKPQNPGGYQTICEGSASRAIDNNSLSLTEKVRKGVESGKDPLRLEFNSSLGNSTLSTVLAPAPGYLLDKIVVRVNPANDCNVVGPGTVTFHFSNGNDQIIVDPENENAPNISPSEQMIFDALKVPLGMGNVAFPTEQGTDLVEAVCTWIKDQINMDQIFALTQAADIGSLAGSLQIETMRCVVENLVEFHDPEGVVTNACNADDVAASFALSVMSGAPPVQLNLTSDGSGTYSITNLANNTSATATVSGDGSCVVSGNLDYDPEDPNNVP